MTLSKTYQRAVAMLFTELPLTVGLALAGIVVAAIQLIEPVLLGWVIDALAGQQQAFAMIAAWAAFGIIGISAGAALAIYADRFAHRRRLTAMNDAFEHAIALPLGYHSKHGSGAVIGAVLRGTDELFWLWLGTLREQLTAIVGIVFLVPVALAMDVRMTAILGLLAIVYAALNLYVVSKTSTGQSQVEAVRYDVSGRVGDVLGNVTIVQSYTRFAAEVDAMRSMMTNLLSAQYPVLTWWGLLTVLQRSAATIAMVCIFATGSVLTARGEMSIGEIVSFVAFATLLIGKLDQLSAFLVRTQQAAPAIANYFALIDERSSVREPVGAKTLPAPDGHVSYQNVSFQFEGTDQGVREISFEANPGETIALVGATGSGKTTTLALIQRLRAPQYGTILIDSHDTAQVTLSSLRASIAVVFQDAGLFNRSIADNIRIGRPGATDKDVMTAAVAAQAHDFISAKPGGYDFVIGEQGASLSGGERQRIAIARALLKDAPILVLDEATSALDAETEAHISRALAELRRGRTTFIIAHRLSTVRDADKILVLDEGRIVERGRFQDLAAGGGPFARMVREGGFSVPKDE